MRPEDPRTAAELQRVGVLNAKADPKRERPRVSTGMAAGALHMRYHLRSVGPVVAREHSLRIGSV